MTNTTNRKAEKHGPRYAIATFTVRVRGEMGCSMMHTLDAVKVQADCYLSSRPAGVVDVEYSEQCGHCRGAGRVSKNRRKLAWKPCPVCKGCPELIEEMRIATFTGAQWSDRA